MEWELVPVAKFERTYKAYNKKKKQILDILEDNLDEFHIYLNVVGKFTKIEHGFLHKEQNGIVAIDQSGAKQKLEQTRMYIYPCNEKQELVLLMIARKGGKKEQNENINECLKILKKTGYKS